jgi:hypothetical protein
MYRIPVGDVEIGSSQADYLTICHEAPGNSSAEPAIGPGY